MPLFEVTSLLVVLALVWLWYDSIKSRDIAVCTAEGACTARGLQFLDESVAITAIRLERNDEGHLQLHRTYAFEYSDTGANRRPGRIVMLGQMVIALDYP